MKNTIFYFSLLFSSLVSAQITPRNILSKKYSMEMVKHYLLLKEDYKPFPQSPEAWKAVVPDSVIASIIQAGNDVLTYTFQPITATIALDFVRSGDRERHSKISFGKRNALMNLILAESMEHKGRFTEAILNGVWSVCEESYWGVPAHISGTGLPDIENPIVDLFTAETGAVLSMADYFVGDQLDQMNKLIRQRIYYETNHRFFDQLLSHTDRYGWMSKTKPVNNWNPWIMSNWIMSTLLLEKDGPRRTGMIHSAMEGLDAYLNSLGDDGGCDEGPSYWFAAGASVYDCLELLHGATKGQVNIYSEPLIKKMAAYIYKTHIDDHYFVNFADADPTLNPDGRLLYRLGIALHDSMLIHMGHWAAQKFSATSVSIAGFQRPRKVQNLMTQISPDNTSAPYIPLKDAWISDIQVLTARSANKFYLATHGGHNAESHNHNDVGDFIFYANGEPVIIDAGRGNYTARTFSSKRYELWFTQSQYHNLPIIDGFGQLAGRAYGAIHVKSKIDDKEASLSMDIAPAYDIQAGVLSWNRSVLLNRVKNQIEITDDYSLNHKPGSMQQVFMTICRTDLSVAGKINLITPKNETYSIHFDPLAWTVITEYPSTEGMEYSSFKTKWDGHQVQRILFSRKSLTSKGKNSFVISKN